MEKSFLRMGEEISVMILSGAVMLFAFLNNYTFNNNIISFILVLIKSIIFVSVPLAFYLFERNCKELKKVAGIYTSYFIVNMLFIVLYSFISIIVPIFTESLFDVINVTVLLSSLLILIEYFMKYNSIESKAYSLAVMKFIYLIGETVSYPFLLFINKRIGKKE